MRDYGELIVYKYNKSKNGGGENDRRKSFDARLAGRQKYRARIIVISENQRLDSHVEDRIDDKQYAVFRGRFAFVNKYRAGKSYGEPAGVPR